MKKTIITIFLLFLPFSVYAQKMHKGVVLQTFNVEGYTYMEIKDGNTTKWIASPSLDVKKGDVVETSFGMLMPDFESKSLNRTFKEIYFVTVAKVVSSAKEEPKQTKTGTAAQKPVGKQYTAKEVIENKDAFADKIVIFNAKVTKYTPSIMGKNWLHVTDIKDSKIDLVVTTNDKTAPGEVVKIEGKLTINKNLGSGYFFPIIIEEATVTAIKE